MDQYVKQVQNIAIFKLWGVTYFYRPQRSCDKVMFLHVFVILSQHPPQVAWRGGGSLSGGASLSGGSLSAQGGSVQGVSVQGSLSRGSLSRGVSVQGEGSLCLGVCVQRGSLLGRPPDRDPPYGNKWAVRILLQCILFHIVILRVSKKIFFIQWYYCKPVYTFLHSWKPMGGSGWVGRIPATAESQSGRSNFISYAQRISACHYRGEFYLFNNLHYSLRYFVQRHLNNANGKLYWAIITSNDVDQSKQSFDGYLWSYFYIVNNCRVAFLEQCFIVLPWQLKMDYFSTKIWGF